MSAVKAAFSRPIVCTAIGEGSSGELAAAALSDGRLGFLRCVEEDLWEETLEVRHKEENALPQHHQAVQLHLIADLQEQQGMHHTLQGFESDWSFKCGYIKNIVWLASDRLVLVAGATVDSRDMLVQVMHPPLTHLMSQHYFGRSCIPAAFLPSLLQVQVNIPASPGQPATVKEVCRESFDLDVLHVALYQSTPKHTAVQAGALLQMSNGSLHFWSDKQAQQLAAAGFPKPCPSMWALPPAAMAELPNFPPAIGLTASGNGGQPHEHGLLILLCINLDAYPGCLQETCFGAVAFLHME